MTDETRPAAEPKRERSPHLGWFERLGMQKVSAEELGLARILFFGWLAFGQLDRHSALFVPFAALDWKPPGLVSLLGLRFASPGWMTAFDWIWAAALALTAAGVFTRYVSWLSFGLGVYLLGLPHAIGKTHHSDAILVFVLFAFALSRAGDALSVDAWRGRRAGAPRPASSVEYAWPLVFGLTCLVAVYFSAGVAKLRASGLEWAWHEGGRLRLIAHAYTHDPPTRLGLWLAEAGPAHQLMGFVALGFEVLCPLALVGKRLKALFVVGLFSLQFGIWLTLGVFFEAFFALFLLCMPWFDWLAIARRLRARLGRAP